MKKLLCSVIMLAYIIVPVQANTRTWEWAILPAYEVDEPAFSGEARFSEGLAAVRRGGKVGYIDETGAEVIPFIFEHAGPFSEGLAAATVDGTTMGFIRRVLPDAAESSETAQATPSPSPSPSPSPISGEKKTAYITIDDGPSRKVTPGMLDVLQTHDVKATFFVLPQANMDDLYTRIIDEGHTLASHSYSHDLKKLYDVNDLDFFKEDLRKMHRYLQGKGHTPTLFRFPGGSGGRAAEVMADRLAFVKDMGYRHFNWDVSTGDTDSGPAGKDVNALVNNVLHNTQNRKQLVILMHDTADKTVTLEALPRIIEGLREQGYAFNTLDAY